MKHNSYVLDQWPTANELTQQQLYQKLEQRWGSELEQWAAAQQRDQAQLMVYIGPELTELVLEVYTLLADQEFLKRWRL